MNRFTFLKKSLNYFSVNLLPNYKSVWHLIIQNIELKEPVLYKKYTDSLLQILMNIIMN
jgi:hypothetical protein